MYSNLIINIKKVNKTSMSANVSNIDILINYMILYIYIKEIHNLEKLNGSLKTLFRIKIK